MKRELEYKCRRCGKTTQHYCSYGDAREAAIAMLVSSKLHDCDDGGIGISDFIGVKQTKD